MTHELYLLSLTSASIGVLHTLIGPDHYLPFIAMARAGRWTTPKTFWATLAAGVGHVASSIVLGAVGIALGAAVGALESIESVRGDIAAWMLTSFGFAYMIWGIRAALKRGAHEHAHTHADGTTHSHSHDHQSGHSHPHVEPGNQSLTPWIVFTIFIFGPCEPLIPILMYPAATHSFAGVVIVSTVFSLATIGTMLAAVFAGLKGLELLPLQKLDRWMHALAGGTISLSGFAILFFGV